MSVFDFILSLIIIFVFIKLKKLNFLNFSKNIFYKRIFHIYFYLILEKIMAFVFIFFNYKKKINFYLKILIK